MAKKSDFTEEEWDFLVSVQLTGQRIEEWLNKRYPSAESIKANALVVA